MPFDEELYGDAVVLRLFGNLHAGSGADELEVALQRIVQETAAPVVLDLARLTMLDSTALGVLAGCGRALHAEARELYLAQPNARVALLLKLTQIDGVFPVVPTVEAALKKSQ